MLQQTQRTVKKTEKSRKKQRVEHDKFGQDKFRLQHKKQQQQLPDQRAWCQRTRRRTALGEAEIERKERKKKK